MRRESSFSRRAVLQAGGVAAGAVLGQPGSAAPRAGENVFTRLGVRPLINMTATYTINGGAPMLPEVRQAMEEAAEYAVNLDELMEKAGERIAALLGAEACMVSSGCAAALVHATAACMAGGDPEKMKQLPDSRGLRDEVIMPKQSRNDYDHAFRAPGARIVEVDTLEEFHAALGIRTAMVAVLGVGEAAGKMRLEQMAEAAHKHGVPVLVDAAAELPWKPNPYLSRGADLAGYSGGKILRGPQSAGLLLGRKDLVQAAWLHSAPHHALGRPMKVSKEEVVGMVAAIEYWAAKRKIEEEYRTWERWYGLISDEITKVPGVAARLLPPKGASPFPVLEVSWDPERVKLTGGELYRLLMDGEPRIMSHAGGELSSFVIRAVAMKPEHPPMVARRLAEVFREASNAPRRPAPAPPQVELTGAWEADLKFVSGAARHTLVFSPPRGGSGNRIAGTQIGRSARGPLSGKLEGNQVRFRGVLVVEGMRLQYSFSGTVSGDSMSGEVELGEFGRGSWTARRS